MKQLAHNTQIQSMGGRQFLVLYVVVHIMTIYLPTPYSTVLLEKLTGFQLVKKFPAFYGTAFTSARHLSLPSACNDNWALKPEDGFQEKSSY